MVIVKDVVENAGSPYKIRCVHFSGGSISSAVSCRLITSGEGRSSPLCVDVLRVEVKLLLDDVRSSCQLTAEPTAEVPFPELITVTLRNCIPDYSRMIQWRCGCKNCDTDAARQRNGQETRRDMKNAACLVQGYVFSVKARLNDSLSKRPQFLLNVAFPI